MVVLVTGATGFVGSCLTKRLIADELCVHIITRKSSDKWRLVGLSGFIEHETDLRNADDIEKLVAKVRPEIVFHLATYGGFTRQNNTMQIFETNVLGTLHLLRACERIGVRCFVNTGSSSEYGLKDGPMKEEDLLEPIDDYGVTKAAATLYCSSAAFSHGFPSVTLRLFSPYGPWDDRHRFIPYVISSYLDGKRPMLGSPDNVRDYVFIDDIIQAYTAFLSRSPVPGAVYNVGAGRQCTIGEVDSTIRRIIGTKLLPRWGVREASRPEPKTWVASINKVATDLGWSPHTPLEEGLEKTVAWFCQNLVHSRGD